MILYHGSTIDIEKIDLAKSKPNKDFGKAFYLSLDKEQAMEMAQFKAEFEDGTPVVNAYEFDEANLQQLRYKRFEDYTEEWAHFVYDHRTEPNGKTLHDYDIFDEFLRRIQYIKGITFQYAFCTQKAIEKLIKK